MSAQPAALRFTLIVRGVKTHVLPNAPSGWEGSLITVKRSDTYYGMMRTFTVPMDFVLDGAWILRSEFYQYGIMGNVLFQIEELDTESWTYKIIYSGQIDFSKIKDQGSLEGYKFTCSVMQDDFNALVAAYEGTDFEIPLDDPDAILINLPGMELNETCQFNIPVTSDFRSNAFFELDITDNEVNSVYTSSRTVTFLPAVSPAVSPTGQYFFRALVDTDVRVRGNIVANVSVLPGVSSKTFKCTIFHGDGSVAKELVTVTTSTVKQVAFKWDFTTFVAKDDVLSFYITNVGDSNNNIGFSIVGPSELTLSYNTISPPTQIKAFRAHHLYQKLVNKIYGTAFNGRTYPIKSDILVNDWARLCITSGDAFRGAIIDYASFDPGDQLTVGNYYTVTNGPGSFGGTVTYNGDVLDIGTVFICIPEAQIFSATDGAIVVSGNNPAVIKTNFKDFFQSINAVVNAGFGVENNAATIEGKSYWYKKALLAANVGNVEKWELEPATAYLFNTIKGGYPDQTYDVLNGRSEVNSSVQYSTGQTRIQAELNIQSVYRADSYGMEFLRIQLGSKNATKGDNDVFFIHIDAEPVAGQAYYNPYFDPTAAGDDGVKFGSGYFNTEISPKKNLKRHGDFLAGVLYKVEGQIKLSAALKNTSLYTLSGSGTRIAEADPIDISTLPDAYFIPYAVNISTKSPVNMLSSVSSFPTGYIAFTKDGDPFMGFMLSVEVDPAKNSERQMKLLLTSQNNLLPLIR